MRRRIEEAEYNSVLAIPLLAKDRVIGCAFRVKLDFAKAALAKRALITFTRSQALDQIDRRAKRQRHLLLPATDTQHRLRCALNHVENSGERFG